MDVKEFVGNAVEPLKGSLLEEIKSKLIGEYLSFSFIKDEDVTVKVFAEKILDYFEKVELKTGDSFEKILSEYVSKWDDMVEKNIPKEPQAKKGETPPEEARTRKYYKHAIKVKDSRNYTIKQLIDYSRIMMCLYMAVINNEGKSTDEFDYSVNVLDLDSIISTMKQEKRGGTLPNIKKKNMYDLEDLYCIDTCVFVLTMIMYYFIKFNEVEGEY